MTVQELINELMKIEDKSKKVRIFGKWSDCWEECEGVDELTDCVYLED
jgi:hypothetical protein